MKLHEDIKNIPSYNINDKNMYYQDNNPFETKKIMLRSAILKTINKLKSKKHPMVYKDKFGKQKVITLTESQIKCYKTITQYFTNFPNKRLYVNKLTILHRKSTIKSLLKNKLIYISGTDELGTFIRLTGEV